MSAHYRAYLNFTWEALANAAKSLAELRSQISNFKFLISKRNTLTQEKLEKVDKYRKKFDDALANDLNMPQALAVVWEVVKSNISSQDKYDLLLDFDEVLGLNLRLATSDKRQAEIPQDIKTLVAKREELRKQKKFSEADEMRKRIEEKGYEVEDASRGPQIRRHTVSFPRTRESRVVSTGSSGQARG